MRFPAGMSHQSAMGFGVSLSWHVDVLCPAQKMVTYPASGNRNNSNGALNNVGSNGYYWTAAPYMNNTNQNGRNLNFNSSNVNPMNNNNRSNGFAVRPVQAFTYNSTPPLHTHTGAGLFFENQGISWTLLRNAKKN